MSRTGYGQQLVPELMAALCIGALWGGIQAIEAQSSTGHQVSDTRIAVGTQSQWEQWTGPEHVLDFKPDGVVQPHFFRKIYNLIAEDQKVFRRPTKGPEPRDEEKANINIVRTFALERDGSLKLEQQKIEKHLEADFQKFPGNETHIVLDDHLYTVVDTVMNTSKEVTLTLRDVDTSVRSTRKLQTKDKVGTPVYDYFVELGISRVGSNPDAAPNILDGDPETYWEPDLSADKDEWWIEIDLGRVAIVEEIVLHFVDAELGDPFYRFRVLVSPEQKLIREQSRVVPYSMIGGTSAPNTDQRTFSFSPAENPLFEEPSADPAWTGRLVETIRILVSDSRLGRAHPISQEEWEALPPADQGDVIYYIRDAVGFEEPLEDQYIRDQSGVETLVTAREQYENLAPEQQGQKEYFARERPRLSEVEVWGWGDNLSPLLLQGGGSLELTGPDTPTAGFSADWLPLFRMLRWSSNTPEQGVLTVDLGARMWLDAMRTSVGTPVDGYIVETADGSREATGKLFWRQASPPEREDNTLPGTSFRRFVDFYDPPLPARFLNMRLLNHSPGVMRSRFVDINDIQLFSEGYVAEATLTSDIIQMPGLRNLGAIRWDPGPDGQPGGTAIEIRTRTGDLLVEQVRYFDSSGNEKTKETWEKLLSAFKGPVDTSFVVGGGWSSWSQKYLRPGDKVTSPGLRKYMRLQVKFTSEERDRAASIRSVEVDLVEPVARGVLGEVWPQEAVAGNLDTFEVYLRPSFIDAPSQIRTPGFDEILLSSPAGVDLNLLSVSTGTEEEFLQGEEYQHFQAFPGGGFRSASGDSLQVFRDGRDSVWVRFPTSVQSLSDTPQRYYRIMPQGAEVVVGHDGEIISEASYALLSEDERGAILFFKETTDSQGNTRLEEVTSRVAYDALPPEEQGPIRYFRKLIGGGAEIPFDARGDSLTRALYNALPQSERGQVIGTGRLIRLRFATRVFLNGTTLKALVRNSDQSSGPGDLRWQQVDPGDATILKASKDLSIAVPLGGKVLDDVVLTPNPFTPNGDGVNDALEVSFSVFQMTAAREARVRIYALDGRLLWEEEKMALGGPHAIRWTGVDKDGHIVPPGLYLCQVHMKADWGKAKGTTVSRVVAVVY